MKATQQLKDEHEAIKLMLIVLETIAGKLGNGADLDIQQYEKIIEFIKGFADKCHHGKEEDVLFPALVKHGIPNEGGPVGVMLNEHAQGRNHIRELADAFNEYRNGKKESAPDIIKHSMNYVNLLRNHIQKENNILFAMADRVLNDAEQDEIFESFEKIEAERIGPGKHEEYHELLKDLKKDYSL